MTAAQAAIARDPNWERALDEVLSQTAGIFEESGRADLVFLFASAAYARDFPALVRRAREATNARVLVGCSGQGIVGPGSEVENEPAVSLLALSLPGVVLHPVSERPATPTRMVEAKAAARMDLNFNMAFLPFPIWSNKARESSLM